MPIALIIIKVSAINITSLFILVNNVVKKNIFLIKKAINQKYIVRPLSFSSPQ